MFLSFLTVLLSFLAATHCGRILGLLPIPSYSHQVVYQPIWKELSLRGHKVTVVTPNPVNDSNLTNLTEINVGASYVTFTRENIAESMSKDNYAIRAQYWLLDIIEEVTLEDFQDAETLLKNPATEFDLIIVEMHSPLAYSLGFRFKVPIVAVSSFALPFQTHDAVGNPTHPIIAPDLFSNIIAKMTLSEKLASVLHNVWYRVMYYWYFLPMSEATAKKFWGKYDRLGDIEKSVALVLVNTDPLLHSVRPQVPNMIEMGHTRTSTKNNNLPHDLKKYLDLSIQGVIYFNFGTNVKSVNLSPRIRGIIIEALSELPYNVLWKWENDSLPNKPKNVMTRKWLPQQDILKHENIKVFVTQGGLQSMEEAITNCVPMVAVPFIADQPLNVMKMVGLGVGSGVNHVEITKENFKEAILDVAENDKYRKQIWKIKDIFSDKPMKGVRKSVWWIEYILRHKSARHLRSPATDLPWFEYYMADVALLFLFVLFTLFWCCKIIRNRMF